MGVFSFIRRLGKKTSDGLVGVASGSTPVAPLDSPKAYQFIVSVGVIALLASGWLIYRNIIKIAAVPVQANTNTNSNTSAIAKLNELKTKDADGDQVSDYDELYSSHTSPYLKDSDGDGIADNVELQAQSDPNCPKGKVCEGFHLLTSIVDQNGELTPEFLRKALASAGVPQATLDKTNDASLLSIYKQIVQSQSPTNTNSGTNTNTVGSIANGNTNSAEADAAALQQLEQLTPSEIRQLLVQNGVDQATIDGVDDATLKQIFQEAVASSQ